jgi:hypothetical protein
MATHLRKLSIFPPHGVVAAPVLSFIVVIASGATGKNAHASPNDPQVSAACTLPAVIVCQRGQYAWAASDFAETWRITRPTSDAITFECTQECPSREWRKRTNPSPNITDVKG